MPQDDHYVAQTYLRQFSDNDGYLIPYYKNGYVVVGKKKSPRQICYESDGDSNTYFDNPRILDEYLPHIETPWAENIEKLASGDADVDCKYEIGAYIAFLRSCNPTAKRLGTKAISGMLQPFVDKTLAEYFHELGETTNEVHSAVEKAINDREISAVVDEEYVHAISIQNLIQAAYKLYCSQWLILINETRVPFITSDNPASLYYVEPTSQYSAVFVPLSPSLGVLIKPDFNIDRPTINDVKNYMHEGDDYAHPKENFVNKLNELTARSAENIVLHSVENEWVEELVSNNKEWKVENQTLKLPHENGVYIVSRQSIYKNV